MPESVTHASRKADLTVSCTRNELDPCSQAQIHAPFADLTPIPRFLDRLGAELRRRMEEAGISGGLPGVQMLSEFLFGKAGPGAASNGAAMSLTSLSGSALEAALKLPAPGFGMGLQVRIPPPSAVCLRL